MKELLQLAPSSTAVQAKQTITSMMDITFASSELRTNLRDERDPHPAVIDNFGTAKIQKE